MKKLMAILLAGVMVFSLAACGNKAKDEEIIGGDPATWGPDTTAEENADGVQIPAPFQEYSSLEEAKAAAGFSIEIPETVNGQEQKTILVYDDKMIQVDFGDEENSVTIRKAPFGEDGAADISGVHTTYSENNVVTQDGNEITVMGENGTVYLATWTAGEYNYSIYAEAGMSQADMLTLIASMN